MEGSPSPTGETKRSSEPQMIQVKLECVSWTRSVPRFLFLAASRDLILRRSHLGSRERHPYRTVVAHSAIDSLVVQINTGNFSPQPLTPRAAMQGLGSFFGTPKTDTTAGVTCESKAA